MHEIMELKENLMAELGEYARTPKLSVEDVMVVKALSSAVDHLCNIVMAAEEDEGYAMRGSQSAGRYSREGRGGGGGNGRYSRESSEGRYSREGNSYYARGRRGNVRRDSMGRYAREGGYARADGMEELVEEINGMMGELPQNLQQEAQKFMQKLEQEM